MHHMLQDINRVDWKTIDGAYGPAIKVPELLKLLVDKDSKTRQTAFKDLRNIINHQDSITPAAVVTVPFIRQLINEPDYEDKAPLIILLTDLAVGGTHSRYIMKGYNVRFKEFDEAPLSNPYKAIYMNIASSPERYFEFLSSPDSSLRIASSLLLAFLSSFAEKSLPIVRQQFQRETDEKVQASLMLCLAFLNQYLQISDDVSSFVRFSQGENKFLRFISCLSIAHVDWSKISSIEENILLDGLQQFSKPLEDFPWNEGDMWDFGIHELNSIAFMQKNFDLLMHLLDITAGNDLERFVGSAMIDAFFENHHQSSPLSSNQQTILKEILSRKLVPYLEGALEHNSLPTNEKTIEKLLKQ